MSLFDDLSDLSAGDVLSGAIDLLTNSPLKLGSISFSGMEIPERMPFGGKQQISRKTLIGGKRILEATGPDPVDPAWSGRFQGSNAMQRARAVDALCKQGTAVTLTYGGMSYSVLIREFLPVYERFYQIPYSITCEVITTNASKSGFFDQTLTDLVGSDTLDALGLSDLIGDVPLGQALSATTATLSTVGQITGISAISSIGGMLGSAQGLANTVANIGNTNIQNVAFGVTGALGNAGASVAKLTNAASAASTLANTAAVQSLLGRAQTALQGAS